MKYLFRALVLLGISLTFIGCGPARNTTALPDPSPTATLTERPTTTPLPSPIATRTVKPTATPAYIYPTLVPTIDSTQLPELLSHTFSIQKLRGVNGFPIRQVTGWEYGFGGEDSYGNRSPGYVWLDASHLLLFPRSGQAVESIQGWDRAVNLVPQAVVINTESQATWLPPEYLATSPELGILITSRMENETPNVTTYKFDGRKQADYRGHLLDVSPSGTKILIDQDTLVDLRTNSRIKLSWPTFEGEDVAFYTEYYWSPDETRVYHCCSYFADLSSGESFRFRINDSFQVADVPTMEESSPYFNGLPYMNGEWVRDSTYFLVEWSWVDDGDIGFLPMFDPAKKIIYDVREMAGISEDWHSQQTTVSPDTTYIWFTGWGEKEEGSYLVNLNTFDSHYFPGEYLNIDWSPNSKFAWLSRPELPDGTTQEYSILSTTDMEVKPLLAKPANFYTYWWNPDGDTVIYPGADNQALIFMNVASMTYQELPFPLPENTDSSQLAWSPNGDSLALTAEDGSLWQVDTPKLENLEQLTEPMADVRDVYWSPDGSSISFVGGTDIFIVDTAQ